MVTDLDFADDIVLVSDTAEMARGLLLAVERECVQISLKFKSKKTKVMCFNTCTNDPAIATLDGKILETKNDFKYLGSWISSTEHDIKIRRVLAWKALHRMRRVWKSKLKEDIKRQLFISTVESVLLYGAETWTPTAKH